MASPLPPGELQFCDADGHPFAGGTLDTYVSGTSTPKTTWLDQDETAANTNPVILDAAGRAVLWGDGGYRCVLRDAQGNLIWDQETTTIVSDAMAPVVMAPTVADALELLGVQDSIDAAVAIETTRAEAVEAAETTRAAGVEDALDLRIGTEINDRIAGDAALQAQIDAEIARAEAAEAALGALIAAGVAPPVGHVVQTGTAVSNSAGDFSITYGTPFPTNVVEFEVTGPSPNLSAGSVLSTLALATGQLWQDVGLVLAGTLAISTTFTFRVTGY